MKLIIDRFEEGFAVLEAPDCSHITVRRDEMPDGACEGSVLEYSNGVYSLDTEETEKRRRMMQKKLRKLFKNR